MFKSTLKILPALMVAITAAFVTQPVNGQVPNTLVVFTEESSTVLDATAGVGGAAFGSVSLNSADQWTWTLPADRPAVLASTGGPVLWLEPESTANQTLANIVESNFSNGMDIFSDFDATGLANPILPDGTISHAQVTFNYVGGSTETFDVQFFDKGDAATVPDTGTTFSLLGLSFMGLAILRRKIPA